MENIEPLVPRMTNKIALVDEVEETDGDVKILRESIKYFDKVFAVESKDLKFFFDDDEEVHDNLMYCYFMQVSPHQQNVDQLNEHLLKTINDKKSENQKKTLEVFILLIKSSQNKKGQKNFQVHSFRCLFLQLAAEKKTPKTVHLENFFGPSYFETALGNMLKMCFKLHVEAASKYEGPKKFLGAQFSVSFFTAGS